MPSIPLIIDSGFAENVSVNGNRCGISFSPPLQIPRDVNPRLRLYSTSFAYNFPNVSADLGNNKLVIDRLDSSNVQSHQHTVTFQDGLYGSLDDLVNIVNHSIHDDANFQDLDFSMIGVAATQKVHIVIINSYNDTIRLKFTGSNSIGTLLGFTANKLFGANATTQAESDTTASLDKTTSVLIQTSLCNGSVVAGKGGQSTLAMIHLAQFAPASVIAYTPQNLLEVPATNLVGASITNATFALVNQNNEDLNTLNEAWQIVLEIVWD